MIFGYSGNFRKKNFFKVFQKLQLILEPLPNTELYISSDFQLSQFNSNIKISQDKILSFEELNKHSDIKQWIKFHRWFIFQKNTKK